MHTTESSATLLLPHACPWEIDATGLVSVPPCAPSAGSDAWVDHAARSFTRLPSVVRHALAEFAAESDRSGALLLRGMPVGQVPATPSSPTASTGKDLVSETTLLTVARALGEPVGYLPEHGGDLVQNLVPTQGGANRQTSTSSAVTLMFHTEAAFHPHRPRFLLLLCLRGDPAASTTLSSIREVGPLLDRSHWEALFEPRFRTAVDESYLDGGVGGLGPPAPVLSGDPERPTMVFDADLMQGTDPDADAALHALAAATAGHHTSVTLERGDLLIIDNQVAVHGRSPFAPRFDGTDRWLQRAFVVPDLAASATERQGRVIVTQFGQAA